MTRPAAAAALLGLVAALVLPLAVQAHSDEVTIHRLSYDPYPGDYTMVVRVENFEVVPANASAPESMEEGQIAYFLNGFPCQFECAAGQPFRTNSTHFTYHRLVVGDVLAVELQTSKGRPLDPPVRHNVTVVEGPVQCEEAAERLESCGPFIAVTSGTPNPGDYTMRLRVERFTLLEPGSGSETDLDTGHIVYTRNGVVCEEGCSGAAVGTDTVITFQDVQLKDRLAAELVRPDGSSLQPLVKTVVVVTRPAIRLISPAPQETAEDGEYEMEVHVTGFTLAAPGGIENAGTGHIRYLYKAEGARDFVPVPRSVSCEGSPATARTASTTFRLCDLSEGDQLAAELVDASGDPLDPPVRSGTLTVRRLPGEPFLIPAVGPEIAILLVGLAALRRKTET